MEDKFILDQIIINISILFILLISVNIVQLYLGRKSRILVKNIFLIIGIAYPIIKILFHFAWPNFFINDITSWASTLLISFFGFFSSSLISKTPSFVKHSVTKEVNDYASSIKYKKNYIILKEYLGENFISFTWKANSSIKTDNEIVIETENEKKSLIRILNYSSKIFSNSLSILKNKQFNENNNDNSELTDINEVYSLSLDVLSSSYIDLSKEINSFKSIVADSKESEIPLFIIKRFNNIFTDNNYKTCLNVTNIFSIKEYYFFHTGNYSPKLEPNSRRIFLYDLKKEKKYFKQQSRYPKGVDIECVGKGIIFKKNRKIPYLFWLIELHLAQKVPLIFAQRSKGISVSKNVVLNSSMLDFSVKSNKDSRLVIAIDKMETNNFDFKTARTKFKMVDKKNPYCSFCREICDSGYKEDITSLFEFEWETHKNYFINQNSFDTLKSFLRQNNVCQR